MNITIVLTGCIFLIFAGIAGAEYLSTSISTDGTLILASSGQNENGSFVTRIMAVDESELSRMVTGGEKFQTELSARGSGPILVSDDVTGKEFILTNPATCIFLTDERVRAIQHSNLYTAGILKKGTYVISRNTGSELTGTTEINGTGMMFFGSSTNGNNTMQTSGFASGNMTIRDFIKYGGKI